MIYITFTGISKFNQTKYYFDKASEYVIYDSCVQAAIVYRYGEYLKKIYVFLTEDPRCQENFEHIEKVAKAKNPDVIVEKVIYNTEDSFDELLERVISIVDYNDELILGITNTLRNIPLSVVQLLPYIQAYKNLNIKHIFYGKYNADVKEVAIQDYVQYFFSSKVITYLTQFKQSLRVPPNVKAFGNAKVLTLLTKMNSLNNQRMRSEIYEELNCFKDIYSLCLELSKEDTIYRIYLEDIIQELQWTQEYNTYVQMNQMASYMFSKGYYQHAITILDRNRTVIIAAILLGENIFKAKIKNKLMQNADEIIKSLDGTARNQKFENSTYLNVETKKEMRKIFKYSQQGASSIKKFSDIRNTIDHGRSFANGNELEKTKREIKMQFDSYLSKLTALAKLDIIWTENPKELYVGKMSNKLKK